MAPKNKDKGKKEKKGDIKEENLAFEPVVYITNKVSTMIEMLDSPETKLQLRIIGTLSKVALENDANLEYMLSCGLYNKLKLLLSSSDIYTIRFTLSLIQGVVTKAEYLSRIVLEDIFITAALIKELYLKQVDRLVKQLSVNILVNLCKYNSNISDHIYSTEVVNKIFENLKTDKNLEVALNNVELFFYLLDSTKAKEGILECTGFSITCLLCLLDSTYDSLKELTINILHRLANWKKGDVLLALGKEKVVEAMMRLLFSEAINVYERVFEIIRICLTEDECAINFVKSYEFVKFLEWIKHCMKVSARSSSLILKVLSEKEQLLQVLFDFSAEESAISLFRFVDPFVTFNVCDLILNMMRNRYCCESMATPTLMKIFVEIINDDQSFPMIPYGEKALETLHRFFSCYVKTAELVHKADCMSMLIDIFIKAKAQMSKEGYIDIIEIIQFIIKSKYCEEVRNIGMYQLIIDLYIDSTFEEDKILTILESFIDCDEFREIFLERGVLKVMMDKIRLNHKDVDLVSQTLVVIRKLIIYKKIGTTFINEGFLMKLRFLKEELKLNTCICDEIIDTLLDFSLSLKFFYKKKLYENDKIKDLFMVIPDALISIPLKSLNFKSKTLSTRIPIYVVNLQEVMHDEKDVSLKYMSDANDLNGLFYNSTQNIALTRIQSEVCFYNSYFAALTQESFQSFENFPRSISKVSIFSHESFLAKIIREAYREFYETKSSRYSQFCPRVKYIAKKIDQHLSGKSFLKDHVDRQHAFDYYLRKLMSVLDTNFIPIGRLRFGFQCERALAFKIICDQLGLPTTFCKKDDSYFNEVKVFKDEVNYEGGNLLQKKFIVDLMENVGNFIPADRLEATMYLKRNETKF